MVHRASQISVGKRDAAEGRVPQNFSRGRLTTSAKEESGLRAQISVTPAVQDNAGDVPLRAESGAAKHLRELFSDLSFIVSEGCSDQLRSTTISLLFR